MEVHIRSPICTPTSFHLSRFTQLLFSTHLKIWVQTRQSGLLCNLREGNKSKAVVVEVGMMQRGKVAGNIKPPDWP